jgi:hypothetical protein
MKKKRFGIDIALFYRCACKFPNYFQVKPLDFVNNSFQKSGFKQKSRSAFTSAFFFFCNM